MRIGVLGGSFDPPHMGHVTAAVHALVGEGLDRVVWVPVFAHPFSKALTQYELRVEMCRLAIQDLSPRMEVSRIEAELGGTSYTFRTLEHMKLTKPHDELYLIVGSDTLKEKDEWKHFDEIEKLARILVLHRPGFSADAPATGYELPDISSSRIREMVARGISIHGLVPQKVERFIEDKFLYKDG